MSRKTPTLLAILFLCGSARADLLLEYEGGHSGGVSAMAIANGKIRIDNGSDTSVVFDPKTDTILTLDHRKRRFTRIGPREMEEMQAALRAATAELDRAMAELPPEIRAQMQQGFMGGVLGGKPAVSSAPTGRSDQVQGIACRFHRIEALGRLVAEVCIADHADVPWLGREEHETLNAMQRMQERLLENLREGPLSALLSNTFNLQGLPLVHIDHSGGKALRSTLSRVSRDPLPAALFDPPAGYQEEKLHLR
ncbi:MAG: hypothetical protein KatS3mg125_0185 [Lysobacterales bacterium]|nr:MAG: hypothetical protein KatS3mg125_0185 [Xanthomonadales bacterium]